MTGDGVGPYTQRVWNENRRHVQPILNAIKQLRGAYADAGPGDLMACDKAVTRLKSLLSDPGAASAIDRELARRPPLAKLANLTRDKELVEREADLARSFGFKPREAKRYIKRSRDPGSTEALPDIGSVASLVDAISSVHDDLHRAMTAAGPGWKSWRRRRQAREEADVRVFAIGAIVADTMQRALFEFSYAAGVCALIRRAA